MLRFLDLVKEEMREAANSQAETLDELNRNLRDVILMLLEDGAPVLNSWFVGTQQVAVGDAKWSGENRLIWE